MPQTKTYIEVDRINGITYSDRSSMDGDEHILHNEHFFESIENCNQGEILYGCVSDEWLKKIKDKYGVNYF